MSSNTLSWARELRDSLAAEIERLSPRTDVGVKPRVAMFRQQLAEAEALIAYLESETANISDVA